MRAGGEPASLEDISLALKRLGVAASTSYLSIIENGHKVPAIRVAEGLAQVLGEDVDLFRSWAMLKGDKKAGDFATAAAVLRQRLPQQLLSAPGIEKQYPRAGEIRFIAAGEEGAGPPNGIPIHRSLNDWDCVSQPIGGLLVAPALRAGMQLSSESFVFPLTGAITTRVRSRGIVEGLLGSVTPDPLSLQMGEIYVVRHEGQLVLSHLWWDQQTLVLLPDHVDDDIVRIEVTADGLADHIVGLVGTLILPAYVEDFDALTELLAR